MANTNISRQVWGLVQGLDMDEQFTAASLVERWPHLANGLQNPARSVGRAMAWLLQRQCLMVVGSYRITGHAKWVNIYQRTPPEMWLDRAQPRLGMDAAAEPEPMCPIKRTPNADGSTRVRFGNGWKPTPNRTHKLSLYAGQSSMISEYL